MAQGGQFLARDEWRSHGMVAVTSMAGIALCSSHGYTIGVMIAPLEDEFHWSRAGITGGLLIISTLAVFLAPAAGRLADSIGPRKVALAGVPLFCLAFGMLSLATSNIWSWWALWLLLTFGNMAILPTIWAASINTHFDRNRGKALALAMCGTGLASFILPRVTPRLIEAHGWRWSYVAIALAGFLIVYPLTLAYFRSAGEKRGERPAAPPRKVLSGDLKSSRYLKLLGASTFFSVTICALTTNAAPLMRGFGYTPIEAGDIASWMGFGSIIGRLLGGVLLDRFDAKRVAAISVMAPVITALLLLAAGDSHAVAVTAMLILGLAIGTEVDCCSYLVARHFGTGNFGSLFGTINGLMLFGNGIAPFAANYVYDMTHSYAPVLWVQLPACLASAVLFLMLGRYPDEEPRNATA
ncbi:MAG: MFS transporter [Novosphingobium sp.]